MPSSGGSDGERSTTVRSTEDLARLVRARRRELGLTQEALAGVTGLDRVTLVMFEQGKRRMSIDRVITLVQTLGMDIVVRRRAR